MPSELPPDGPNPLDEQARTAMVSDWAKDRDAYAWTGENHKSTIYQQGWARGRDYGRDYEPALIELDEGPEDQELPLSEWTQNELMFELERIDRERAELERREAEVALTYARKARYNQREKF